MAKDELLLRYHDSWLDSDGISPALVHDIYGLERQWYRPSPVEPRIVGKTSIAVRLHKIPLLEEEGKQERKNALS